MAEEQGKGTGADSSQNTGETQERSRTFTQAELDAIIQDRLGRERQKYADYDSLRQAKAELEKLKQSQMSDVEKLTQAASESERRAIAAETRIAQAEIKADFTEKALAAGVADLRLAYLAAQAEGLLGEYDSDKGVGKHDFAELKKRYPHLFRATAGGSADGGAGGGAKASSSMNEWIRRSTGRT